jgi:2',3'-cyclic-nucleotide 2'-phosphodiesterase/3'-nucleotidase
MPGVENRTLRRVLVCWLVSCVAALSAPGSRRITILETSDVHGHILNWDYVEEKEAACGLASVATIVQAERRADPDLLLLDGGDTIQGTPLVYFYNVMRPNEINPMAAVMNLMKYDAMAVGNHDYDFGQKVLDKFVKEAKFPVLCANIQWEGGKPRYTPYVLREVKGVKVGILGLTTPGIPVWEAAEHIQGLEFQDAVETAKAVVPEMKRRGASVVVGLVHSGLHVEPKESGSAESWKTDYRSWRGSSALEKHNFAIRLAEEVPGIDVILAGHAHSTIPEADIHGVLVVEPSYDGRGVSKVTLTVGQTGSVTKREGTFIRCSGEADSRVLGFANRYQGATMAYMNTRIGEAAGPFPGGFDARRRDGPLADLLNAVQFSVAKAGGHPAQVSAVSLFLDGARLEPGPIRILDAYRLYPYENTVCALEVTGEILKRAMEHDAEYWSDADPASMDPSEAQTMVAKGARPYNWDMYAGVDYAIDLAKPKGQRIVGLSFKGRPVADEQTLTLAVSNHRASGGGGYSMLRQAKVVWESKEYTREQMIRFVQAKRILHPEDFLQKNWSLLPERLSK